jgi:hypothetical protein
VFPAGFSTACDVSATLPPHQLVSSDVEGAEGGVSQPSSARAAGVAWQKQAHRAHLKLEADGFVPLDLDAPINHTR